MTATQRALASSLALVATMLLSVPPAQAGGPLVVRSNGTPYVWSTTDPIPYSTDNGPLSATVNESAARARVLLMFSVWQNVASSSIGYTRVGFISDVGDFTDDDVSTAIEYDAVDGDCNNGIQSPIIYDTDAAIFNHLGVDETSVIGFAGPCALNASNYLSGLAVMNGLFQDGDGPAAPPVADISTAEFDAAFVHEFGHFSGLDHSQINVSCQFGCLTYDLAGLPTMFPLLVDVSQGVLSVDDIAWISRLYPQTTGAGSFANTHGTITGTVYFSDGESHAQLVNVIARQVDTGLNQDRTTAGSVVSGYRFRVLHGNPINDPGGAGPGGSAPALIGLYEIPVPPGNYTVEVESIDPGFTEGSSVGGPILIPMPGAAPAPIGPINVAAGSTTSGHDIVLIGTSPRFDQFEGP
jgi:hypothetical protein